MFFFIEIYIAYIIEMGEGVLSHEVSTSSLVTDTDKFNDELRCFHVTVEFSQGVAFGLWEKEMISFFLY